MCCVRYVDVDHQSEGDIEDRSAEGDRPDHILLLCGDQKNDQAGRYGGKDNDA